MRSASSSSDSLRAWVPLLLLVLLLACCLAPLASAASSQAQEEFSAADKNADSLLSQEEFADWRGGGPKMPMAQGGALDFKARAMSFWTAFLNSVAMIIVTELGDKTFFIAAVMVGFVFLAPVYALLTRVDRPCAHPRLVVYLGAMGALAGMTVLSAAIGFALPHLLPRIYTHYASIVMFAFFGFKLLSEAYELYKQKGPEKKNEELEEVEAELGGSKHDPSDSMDDVEGGIPKAKDAGTSLSSPARMAVFIQAFSLTFFAEWGDRSQIATIALAAVHDPIGVSVGGILGHACCTGLAVLGGRLLATRISERQVALAGGLLFLAFAIHSFFVGP